MAETRDLQLLLTMKQNVDKELKKVSSGLTYIKKDTDKSSDGFIGFSKAIALATTAFTVLKKTYDGLKLGFTIAADMQTAEVGLTTLLGSSEEAKETIKRLKEEAKRTPFELPGLTQATQLLTSVTKDGDKSIDILLNVGEALSAMGKGQVELDRIIVNLQQVAAVGKASAIDIKQFAFAGIPIYEMLSESTGKYGDELQALIEDGGVTFDMLTKMFDEANDSGGRFFGAFQNQSGTFNQALSNLKDSFGIFMSDIVESSGLFDGLTQAMVIVSNALSDYKSIVNNTQETLKGFISKIEEKTGLITMMQSAWDNVVLMFNERLKPALMELWEAMQPILPYLETLAKVFGIILLGAILAFIKIVEAYLIIAIEATTLIIEKAISWINYFKSIWEGVIDVLSKVVTWIDKVIEKIKSLNILKGAKSMISGFLGFGGARAMGGPVSGGKSYLVGEKGPELFSPSVGGNIIPNNKLSSGNGTTVIVNINGDVSGQELVSKVSESIMNNLRRQQALSV